MREIDQFREQMSNFPDEEPQEHCSWPSKRDIPVWSLHSDHNKNFCFIGFEYPGISTYVDAFTKRTTGRTIKAGPNMVKALKLLHKTFGDFPEDLEVGDGWSYFKAIVIVKL